MQIIALIIAIPLLFIAYCLAYAVIGGGIEFIFHMLGKALDGDAAGIAIAVVLGLIGLFAAREYILGCLGCLGTVILIAILIAIF